MLEDVKRFRVIDGGEQAQPSYDMTLITGQTEHWEAYQCRQCSHDLGFPFAQLHEVRIGTFVTRARGSAGKVTGGQLWLACPRCHQLKFQISGASPANDRRSAHQPEHPPLGPEHEEG